MLDFYFRFGHRTTLPKRQYVFDPSDPDVPRHESVTEATAQFHMQMQHQLFDVNARFRGQNTHTHTHTHRQLLMQIPGLRFQIAALQFQTAAVRACRRHLRVAQPTPEQVHRHMLQRAKEEPFVILVIIFIRLVDIGLVLVSTINQRAPRPPFISARHISGR